MKNTLAALAGILVMTITATACGSEDPNESIRFAENGNIYMPQALCDQDEIPEGLSKETEDRLQQWYIDRVSGKHDGRVVCTK